MAAVLLVFLLAPTGLAVVVLQSGDVIVPSGAPARLDCSMAAGFSMSIYTMLWYRQDQAGAPLEFLAKEYDGSQGRFQASIQAPKNLFSLGIAEPLVNDSSRYYCAARGQGSTTTQPAYFGHGTKLTVLENGHNVTEPNVEVLGPSNNECRKKTLVCVAKDFYPDHVSVSWQVDGREQTVGVATDSRAERVGRYYRISSRLRVPAISWFTAGRRFTCIVRFYNGTGYINRPAEAFGIQGKAQGFSRDKYMTVAQAAKASYMVFIVKSCIYGGFVAILLWKHQKSTGKRSN